MESMVIAIVVIVAGAAAWVVGPSVAGAANRGKAKLLGVGLMLAGIGVAGLNTVVIVNAMHNLVSCENNANAIV